MNKISVITVTYNAEKFIDNTIKSVLIQDYPLLEYVVVDGQSSDSTYKIIASYNEKFQKKGIEYKHVCDKDSGIFDAMNKAVNIATGDYIIFINANDFLASGDIVSRIFSVMNMNEDVIYGNHYVLFDNCFEKKIKPLDLSFIMQTLPFSHQSVFVKRELLITHPFNTEFTLCADYDQFLHLYLENKKFKYIDLYISYFSAGGACQRNVRETRNQVFEIRRRAGIITSKNFIYYWIKKELYILKISLTKDKEPRKQNYFEKANLDYLKFV